MNYYKINKIKVNDSYITLFFGDNDKTMISIDDYTDFQLSKDKNIDIDTYNKLKDKEKVLRAYLSCLKKLSIKDYSISNIIKSISKYELNKEELDNIILKLKNYGLLDDTKYCQAKISYYNKLNYSLQKIKQKLINDGIAINIINKYLLNDFDNEYQKAYTNATKYMKTINNKAKRAKKQSIFNKLCSSGFEYDIVKEVINNIDIVAENEQVLLNKEYNRIVNKYAKKYEGYQLKTKIYNSLLLKGFNSDDIKEIMEVEDVEKS